MAEAKAEANARQVQATLNYVVRGGEPLYNYYNVEPPPGRQSSSEVKEPQDVVITSLRDLPQTPRVDVEGFELVPFKTAVKDIYDGDERMRTYDPEVAELIKRRTGASEVRVFFPFLRGEEAQRRAPGTITAPAGMVHVDYTHDSGPQWFDTILGPDADRFRGRSFAIINVWRPITGPLQDHPLAVCDVRTLSPDDYIVSKTYSRVDENGMSGDQGEAYVSETYAVGFNAAHRWYYAPDMMPDEVLLLKNYDSRLEGVARFSPHAAFVDPTTPANALPRASIEVRTLAIW